MGRCISGVRAFPFLTGVGISFEIWCEYAHLPCYRVDIISLIRPIERSSSGRSSGFTMAEIAKVDSCCSRHIRSSRRICVCKCRSITRKHAGDFVVNCGGDRRNNSSGYVVSGAQQTPRGTSAIGVVRTSHQRMKRIVQLQMLQCRRDMACRTMRIRLARQVVREELAIPLSCAPRGQ